LAWSTWGSTICSTPLSVEAWVASATTWAGRDDRAAEGAVAALDAAVLHGDLEVVERDPGELDRHQVGVGALMFSAGAQLTVLLAATACCWPPLAERPGKHPVHLGQLVLGAAEVFDLMPLRPDRHWLSLVTGRDCALAARGECGSR
jgi:hypothetical protein